MSAAHQPSSADHYDVVIIGSGFGGSVSALRLAEKGYRVAVLEAGRRFADDEFAKTSWHIHKFLWAPKLGMLGIQRIHLLKDVMVLAGAGVGGGSLNYANTLYKPTKPFFTDPQWAHITDWEAELTPHYEVARQMLGVVTSPLDTAADKVLKRIGDRMGVGDTYVHTPVGVFLGAKVKLPGERGETVPDPYFGGVGPDRTVCTECGSCMTGCRVGAKNTLVKNYLGLAEKLGVTVFDRTTVTGFDEQPDGSWAISTRSTVSWGPFGKRSRVFTADQLIVAAGTFNTQKLLHNLKADGRLPKLSDSMGRLTRTNSEAILGARQPKVDLDFTDGVAITSSIHPTNDTHIEVVRYGKGSNLMGMLQTLLTSGGSVPNRLGQILKQIIRRPSLLGTFVNLRHWSERTLILLVMQNRDNSLRTFPRRFGPLRWISTAQGHGEPNPTWIPLGNKATEIAAEEVGGITGGNWGDVFNAPATAHYLGGCAISDHPENGVIDPYHRVWNYPTLYVVDGAAISANLGVNPSLSISAQAERAASMWANKGQADPRPAQGEPYRTVAPVLPNNPIVPATSPASLVHRPAVALPTPGVGQIA